MDNDVPRLGDRKLTPRGKRRVLVAATGVWLLMTVGGFVLGYGLAGGSKRLIAGIFGCLAGWILFLIALRIFLGTLNVRRDRHPNTP